MGTHQDISTLKTLADAVTETAASENGKETAGSGSCPNADGIRVSHVGAESLDVNTAFDGGGAVVGTKRVMRTETRVEKRMVGPNGPDSGSGELKGNGVSLGVVGEGEKNCGYPDGRESGRGNRRGPGRKFGEVNGSVSAEAKMGDNVRGGKGGIEDLNDDGGVYAVEMDGGKEGNDDVEYMEDHGYSVGDLVWGKIKSHPWWPGQIYDPFDASKSAVKYNQKGRLLVAYFGDGSFAWCLPSQLIPFAQHFEEMSNQSSSKTFVNAVQEAVDEIGRLVELEMTCPCVPEKNRNGLTRPLAVNAGIKAGVLVPDGDIGKLLSFRYDPAELLATVKNAAESVSFAGTLELAILKSWLSAFYRARGGYLLPTYYEPFQIEGLEDKNHNETVDTNDFSIPIEVPIHRPLEEDWLSSAASGPENGQAPQEAKIYHGRKEKSVAELMAEGTGAKPKSRKRSSSREGTNASNSAVKKHKFNDEVENHIGSFQAASGRKRGRKKTDDISQSGEPKPSDAQNGSQSEIQTQERSLLSKLRKDRNSIAVSNDGETLKVSEEMSSPRERKKSKYLSPPYTTPLFRAGNPSSKKDELEKVFEKITNSARMGERMTKAAGKLLESPLVMKCNGNTVEKKLADGKIDISANLNPETSNQDEKKIFDTVDVNASVNEVLSGVQSFAINHLHSWNDTLLDLIGGFISAFRSSMYVNGANYKVYRRSRPGRKRKSLNSEPVNLVNDLNQTGEKSTRTGVKESMEDKSGTFTPKAKTSSKKSIQEKSNTPKSNKAAKGSEKNANNKEVDRKSSPASLIVTFAPGFSLPSKDDIIRTFRKFGDLNEQETDVLTDSCSVQISYTRSSGAEEALRSTLRQSPFGSASVNYKLCYSSAAPVLVESRCQISSSVKETPYGPAVSSQSAADEVTDLRSMREKLQIMTSMLEKCDGKISSEAKSNLDGDIKLLFEKVKMIAETTSD